MNGCGQCYKEMGIDMAKLALSNDSKQYKRCFKRNISVESIRLKLGKKLRST